MKDKKNDYFYDEYLSDRVKKTNKCEFILSIMGTAISLLFLISVILLITMCK